MVNKKDKEIRGIFETTMKANREMLDGIRRIMLEWIQKTMKQEGDIKISKCKEILEDDNAWSEVWDTLYKEVEKKI